MTTKKTLKAVLFDWDLTLVNSFSCVEQGLKDLTQHFGVDFTRFTMREIFSAKLLDNMKKMHTTYEAQLPVFPEFEKQMEIYYLRACKDLTILADAPLRDLQQLGLKLGIVTNNMIENLYPVLVKSDISFDAIIANNDLAAHETKSDGIRKALQELAIAEEDSIYVGDHVEDIRSAHAAHVPIIALTSGVFSRDELAAYHPEFIVDTLPEIMPIVKSFL